MAATSEKERPKPPPSFEYCSAQEDADADEQEQHEDEENDLDHDEDEKAPGITGGEVCVDGGEMSTNPRRAIILARRWHGRDGERAAEAPPLNFSSRFGLHLRNQQSAREGHYILPIFDVRCWQMRTFQLGHFGSE